MVRRVTYDPNLYPLLNVSTLVAGNRVAYILAIGPVVYATLRNVMPTLPITAMVQDWTNRAIDGELLQV